MINNLKEFFASRGFEYEENGMYQYGRALYKYSDIGPWVSYTVVHEPATEEKYTIIVKPGLNDEAEFLYRKELHREVRSFFDVEGKHGYGEYVALIKDYLETHSDTEFTAAIHEDEEDGENMGPHIVIKGVKEIPAKYRNVYYEDEDARTKTLELGEKCVGIEVGSIVEGCDFDAPPFQLDFPFEEAEYDKQMDALSAYVNRAWEYCNSTYYKVISPHGDVYWCQWTEFDDKPKGNFEEDEENILEIVTAAGKALFEDQTAVQVPGYPGWLVEEEQPPCFDY